MSVHTATIKRSWIELAHRRFDAEFWVRVSAVLKERETDVENLDEVAKVIREVEAAED